MVVAAKIILSVEDNPINQRLMLRRLQKLDCQVIPAEDGKTCLQYLDHETPDLILMDIGLPDIDGLSLSRTIKDNERWHHIPIIVVSAHATREHKDTSRNIGCLDFFPKPVNFNKLIDTIRSLLN